MTARPPIKWIGNAGQFFSGRQGQKPRAVVCHIMQGTLAGTDAWFQNPACEASAHFGIGTDGEIHQYVSLDDAAWGNGVVARPSWSFIDRYPGVNPNLYTISIEFEGAHPDMAAGRFWTPSDAQMEAAAELIAWLAGQNEIPLSRETVIGHYEIDSVNRPFCPGPNFPFERLITRARQRMEQETGALFPDIAGHWAQAAIERVAGRTTPSGEPLISGMPVTGGGIQFRPDDPLTRAQAAVLLDRLLTIIDSR